MKYSSSSISLKNKGITPYYARNFGNNDLNELLYSESGVEGGDDFYPPRTNS